MYLIFNLVFYTKAVLSCYFVTIWIFVSLSLEHTGCDFNTHLTILEIAALTLSYRYLMTNILFHERSSIHLYRHICIYHLLCTPSAYRGSVSMPSLIRLYSITLKYLSWFILCAIGNYAKLDSTLT